MLIIGGGPVGLRTAIEVALLGGRAVVLEKRDRFSRNNVLHLWPFLIHDLKALGAKKFFGKFCAGAIDHISKLTCISKYQHSYHLNKWFVIQCYLCQTMFCVITSNRSMQLLGRSNFGIKVSQYILYYCKNILIWCTVWYCLYDMQHYCGLG